MSAASRAAMASSPQSAGDTSNRGTPSTNITAFSPEAGPSTGKTDKANGKTPLTLAPIVRKSAVTSIDGDDVFLAPNALDNGPRTLLSPTADVFTPGFPASPNSATPRPGAGGVTSYPPGAIGPRPLGAGALVGDSTPDYAPGYMRPQMRTSTAPGVIGQRAPTGTGVADITYGLQQFGLAEFQSVVVQEGRFSCDENATRAFAIKGSSSAYAPMAIERLLRTCGLPAAIDASRLQSDSRIVVTFTDVRDARQAYAVLETNRPPASCIQPYTPRDLAVHRGEGSGHHVSNYEGQVLVQVFYNQNEHPTADRALAAFSAMLARYGEVKALHSIPSNQGNLREFRVEFFDLKAAARLIDSTATQSQQLLNEFLVDTAAYTPDVVLMGPPAVATPPSAPCQDLVSVTGRSMVPADTPGYGQILESIQRDQSFGRRRGAHGQFTRIEISRIRGGADVRTTVMLRNIPNRVTQAQLKEIVDKTSLGDYDFMYLRIDFANNCNVGYAFINFVDPYAIIPFAEAHQGKRWNEFNSPKVAEISYATVQGLENLVEKFRNSSVMMEHPSFRPKLFHTRNDACAGQEKDFATPNNHSKMRRSIENAECVGLYPQRPYSPDLSVGNAPISTLAPTRQRFIVPGPPARLALRPAPSAGYGTAALSSPGVQALINPPITPLPTPPTTAAMTAFDHPLLSAGGFTTPYTPVTPLVQPGAPMRSSTGTNSLNLVNTSSPSDPFTGRRDRAHL